MHRQARVEGEMKPLLKAYLKHKDITKEEYKMILRKAVPQVSTLLRNNRLTEGVRQMANLMLYHM